MSEDGEKKDFELSKLNASKPKVVTTHFSLSHDDFLL